jgi:SAM-dependent methyltransferase
MKLLIRMLLVCLVGGFAGCGFGPSTVDAETQWYSEKRPSRYGIGKVYMGREISQVLGHRGIAWLERPERQREELPEVVIAHLDLEPDDVVADVGAGSGYFSFRIAPHIPRGRMLAVDVQPEMIEVLRRRRIETGLYHLTPVLGSLTDPKLPEGKVDVVLMVDAYHEFSHPREMMEAIVRSLAPGGRVVLVEYRGEQRGTGVLPLHKMTEAQAEKEMAAVGLELEVNHDPLPIQHILVFRKR